MKYFIITCNSPETGESGVSYKSVYSFENACSKCGTGAKLVGKLHTKGLTKVKKDFFQTLDRDLIVSIKIYVELTKENLKLGDLKQIVDSRNNDLPLYHLSADLYFPPALKKEGLVISEQCPVCKRNGFFNKVIIGEVSNQYFPPELEYSEIEYDFLNQSDIFFTWECMGLLNLIAYGNHVVGYAKPLLIVSEWFKNVFEKLKIKNAEFEPITIGFS